MPTMLPYMASSGLLPKIFEKIQNARRPERFTQDFLETKLGHSGGSARSIIPLLKRLGFLNSDGTPTDLYDQFRNEHTRGSAVAHGMKNAFKDLFDRNEYVYDIQRNKLTSLVVQVTGGTKDDSRIKKIVATFIALNELADFESELLLSPPAKSQPGPPSPNDLLRKQGSDTAIDSRRTVDLRVAYTINLNLPESTDPNVFNAIFKALRDNLLEN